MLLTSSLMAASMLALVQSTSALSLKPDRYIESTEVLGEYGAVRPTVRLRACVPAK